MALVDIGPATSLHAAVLGPANGNSLDITGSAGAIVWVKTGGTAGVLTPEVSFDDGSNWQAAGNLFQDLAGATVVTTPAGTVNTVYKVLPPQGDCMFRLRISTAYVTTGVTVDAYPIVP